MTERAREAAARAIAQAVGKIGVDLFRRDANAAIDAYIAALGETHAIVPREPTEAMMWSFNFVAVDKYNHRNLSQAFAQEVYRAMLNAAEQQR